VDARGLRGWQLLGRVTVSCWSSLTEWAVCRKIFSKASKHTRGRQIGRAVESAADAIHDRGYIFGRWEGTNWMAIFVNPHASTTHPRTRRPSSKWALREKPHAWLPGRFAMQETRSDRHLNGMVTTALGGGAQATSSQWSRKRQAHKHTTSKLRLQNAFACHPDLTVN
jgi:hypothetical protein